MDHILFDADGVTLVKHKFFDEKFSEEYGIPLDKIRHFFKNEFRICQQGKADLKTELAKYLPAWGWQKSVDDFLAYWFATDIPDAAVLNFIQDIRAKGTKCYLASDQEKYRAEYFLSNLGFGKKFDKCFFSCDLGCNKSEKEFFEKVLEDLNLKPVELTYWDDDLKNVEVSKGLGINARLWEGLEKLE